MTSNTSSPAPAVTDPRPLLRQAVDQAVNVIDTLRPNEFDAPTPCPEYDVRTLVGHVLTVLRRITTVASGGDALAVPRVTTGVDDADLASAAAADAARLAEVWQGDDILDRMLTLPFGTMPGRAAAVAYTQELTVHAWDLATAVGRAGELDDALATACEPFARRFLPAEPRGGPVPFGPVVDVPADAPPYDRLVAWLGRDPHWSAPAGS